MSISLKGVGLVRNEEVWLEGIELEIRDGELTHLVGPPRAGKTSLMRLIAGVARPSTGRIRGVRSRDVVVLDAGLDRRDRRPLGRRLAIAAARRKGARAPDPDEVVTALGLGAAVGQSAREMPVASVLRAALAEAIIMAPPVLLVDEPWGFLPAIAARHLREAVRPYLEARPGLTIVAAASAETALSLDGAVAVMSAGRVIQHGPFAELAAGPRLVRATACHLPRLNLAEVTAHEGALTLSSRTALPATGTLAELAPGRYTLGVAADRLSLHPFDGALEIPGIVALIEVDGGLRRLVAEVGQNVWHLVLPEAIGLVPGEHVVFHVDPADIVVFGDTGVLEWRSEGRRAKMGRG